VLAVAGDVGRNRRTIPRTQVGIEAAAEFVR
jgi:hypothetical protein